MKKIVILVSVIIVSVFCLYELSTIVIKRYVFNNDALCKITIQKAIITNEKNFRIVQYVLDCGATSAATLNVSILEVNKEPQKVRGNIFSAESYLEAVDVTLLSDKTILISIQNRKQIILKAEKELLGYNIKYIYK